MFIFQTVQKIEKSSKDALKRMTVANSKEGRKSFMFRGSVGVWIGNAIVFSTCREAL